MPDLWTPQSRYSDVPYYLFFQVVVCFCMDLHWVISPAYFAIHFLVNRSFVFAKRSEWSLVRCVFWSLLLHCHVEAKMRGRRCLEETRDQFAWGFSFVFRPLCSVLQFVSMGIVVGSQFAGKVSNNEHRKIEFQRMQISSHTEYRPHLGTRNSR